MVVIEVWKPWRNGDYEVSSVGNVRRATKGNRTKPGRVLSKTLLKIGYYKVSPVVSGKNQMQYIHRMVAEVFLGNCPNGMSVNHIDGIKTNNMSSNLEYVTHSENMRHARDMGLSAIGSKHGASKITESDVIDIRRRRESGESLPAICKDYGIARSTASQIATGKRWKHV